MNLFKFLEVEKIEQVHIYFGIIVAAMAIIFFAGMFFGRED